MTGLSTHQQVRLVTLLKNVGVIKVGLFTLKDGSTSEIYIDLRILPNFPQEFKETIDIASDYLVNTDLIDKVDGFIAPPLAGVPLATALALHHNKPFFLARMQSKAHGTKKLIEGDVNGKCLLVVDDVISSGGSKQQIVQLVRNHGGKVSELFVFVNRMPSDEKLISFEQKNAVKVHFLLSLEMLDL